MKRALVIGIDHYAKFNRLYGCVNDAKAVEEVLKRHQDGSLNFAVKSLLSSETGSIVTRTRIKDQIKILYQDNPEIALFYFAGHGFIEDSGSFLITSDAQRGDEGYPLEDLLRQANKSGAKSKIIILDSCHSGYLGTIGSLGEKAVLSEGLTILTAATKDQYASEENDRGVFTTLLVDALKGGAANLVGDITPGSIYAHIDQSLGPWEQRPVFKTNVRNFVSIRNTKEQVSLADLKRLIELFPRENMEFKLNPTFEPEMKGRDEGMPLPNPVNVAKFKVLQKYNRVNLLVPVGAEHMWNAAMESKSCKLTVLGEHYRRLVERERI